MSAKFSKKEAIVFGWEKFKKEWKFLVVIFIVAWVISSILSKIVGQAYESMPISGVVLQIITYAVNAVITLGILKIVLDITDNKKPSWRLLYELYPRALKYIGATILYGLMIVVGLVLLIIPGIYLAIRFQFYAYFIADKNMGIMDSLRASSKATKGSVVNLLAFGLICAGIALAGFLAFGLGILIAIPIVSIASAHVYRKLS